MCQRHRRQAWRRDVVHRVRFRWQWHVLMPLWRLVHPRLHRQAKEEARRIVANAYEACGQYAKADSIRMERSPRR